MIHIHFEMALVFLHSKLEERQGYSITDFNEDKILRLIWNPLICKQIYLYGRICITNLINHLSSINLAWKYIEPF